MLAHIVGVVRGSPTGEKVTTDRDLGSKHVPGHLRLGVVDASVLAVTERLHESKLATLDRRHFAAVRPAHVASLTLLP